MFLFQCFIAVLWVVQVLTEEFLMCGLRLLALSGRLDIRVLFNSLLGTLQELASDFWLQIVESAAAPLDLGRPL